MGLIRPIFNITREGDNEAIEELFGSLENIINYIGDIDNEKSKTFNPKG